MLKYYTNKDLSSKLGINLAKWKRWSREFLPPDPLGGLQSGFTRQYHPDDAFKVFLGGYLVSGLKYTIPEAKQIIDDLHDWLVEFGFYFGIADTIAEGKNTKQNVSRYLINIYPKMTYPYENKGFFYKISGVVSEKVIKHRQLPASDVVNLEWTINKPGSEEDWNKWTSCRVINISELRAGFLSSLLLD